ncbi:MAG: peptidoglycan bridge formation glycyltransferase FemA/FemB family protein [Oscillospiraceae bacterium]
MKRTAGIYDFRGVSGDVSEDNPLYGLFRFKQGFGGDFTEFVGEMDLVLSPVIYWAGRARHAPRLQGMLRQDRSYLIQATETGNNAGGAA